MKLTGKQIAGFIAIGTIDITAIGAMLYCIRLAREADDQYWHYIKLAREAEAQYWHSIEEREKRNQETIDCLQKIDDLMVDDVAFYEEQRIINEVKEEYACGEQNVIDFCKYAERRKCAES